MMYTVMTQTFLLRIVYIRPGKVREKHFQEVALAVVSMSWTFLHLAWIEQIRVFLKGIE